MAGTKPIFEGLKGGDAASFGLAGAEINPHRRAARPQKQILKFKSGLMAPARSTGALAGRRGWGHSKATFLTPVISMVSDDFSSRTASCAANERHFEPKTARTVSYTHLRAHETD